MTSQRESFSLSYYTPLYENEHFESKIVQWRLLLHFLKGFIPNLVGKLVHWGSATEHWITAKNN